MTNIAFLKRSAQDAQPAPALPAESTGDAQLATYTDTRRASRIGVWALALGFGGFLLWAAFAPLDEGVVAPGVVSLDTHRKPVQHLTGGIIKEVFVHEGDQVKENQVLMKLDAASTRANYEASRQKYMSLRAMEGRLLAEQAHSSKINFNPELVEASKDPIIRSVMSTQEQLLAARQSNLGADLQSLKQQIDGQQESVRAYQSMIESRKSQLALLKEELKNTRELVAEGYAPRNRQWELERNVADVSAAISDLQGNVLRSLAAVGDLRSRLISREQDYRKEVETQMADVKSQVQAEEARFHALREDLDRIDIKSPATGQVIGMVVQAPGAVIQPAQKLMDIVPSNEPLLLEAKVQPNFIDRLHTGLPVDIRFNTFAHAPTLVVDGQVRSISKDLITEQAGATTQSYYLARVEVTPEGMKKLGARQMQPGMPTEMVFRTGERSLLNYLLFPLYRRMAGAMKEA
jgi:protease secretion system membrane fusion protein